MPGRQARARRAVGAVSLVAGALTPCAALADGGDGVTSHDLDGDGRADIAIEYELLPDASEDTAIWFADATPTLRRWWTSGAGGWDRDRSHPVSGDFDGDGHAEVAALYDDPQLDAQSMLQLTGASTAPIVRWQSGPGGAVGVSQTRVVGGDFDGDGRDDVVAFGDLPGARTRVAWFRGSPLGLEPARVVWDSGPGNWDLAATKLAAGDIEGDGDDEVVMLYQYDHDVVALWAMPGTPSGPAAPLWRWSSCHHCWLLEPTHLAVGDLDGDGVDDVSMFYDYGDATSSWWVFAGSDLADGGFPSPHQWWRSEPGGFDASLTMFAAGDYDADGRAEIWAFHRYGFAATRFWAFEWGLDGSPHIDVALPPLGQPWGPGWPAGALISAFVWERARVL